jgi:5S rRNA maturation endonuclease (ribonuclease M5)
MNQEAVDKLFRDLRVALEDGAPAIVEGPNDESALRSLGFEGRFVRLSAMSYSELAETLAREGVRRVIVLTDFDKYGEQCARKLRDAFLNESIHPDLIIRKRFKALTGVVEFENLPSLLENEK